MSWCSQKERGGGALRLMGWIARTLGWRFSHALLHPVTAYFMLTAPAAQREAMRRFLRRALGREPGWRDLWGNYFTFASTLLDRVYLLRGGAKDYRIEVSGLAELEGHVAAGRGCVLLGAHLGSFASMNALAHEGCPVEVLAFMDEANAARASAVFTALSGEKAGMIVPLGRPDSMLRAQECVERGGVIGLLADRPPASGGGAKDRVVRVPFLGVPAPFAAGPHVLAAVLKAPCLLAFGLWRGPRHYEIRFEPFADPILLRRPTREADLRASAAAYAAALERIARAHPGNWFNFYDFWEEIPAPRPAPGLLRRTALALPFLAFLAAAVPARAADPLEEVMAALAANRQQRATFVEDKEIAGLADTLPSRGTLRWEAPSTLEKVVTEPFAERLLVSGDVVTYDRAGRARQEINLSQAPEVRALVESIRATHAGDLAELRRHYAVTMEGTPAAWTLRLSPLSIRVRAVVQSITLQGRGGQVLSTETVGNESSRMRITPLP